MKKTILFILVSACSSLLYSQLNFNEVYNNNGSYSMELKYNDEKGSWDWISLNYLESQPDIEDCDLVINGFDQAESEMAINKALNVIEEGDCKILIRYDYSQEMGPNRMMCVKFSNVTTPDKIEYIENEMYKNPAIEGSN